MKNAAYSLTHCPFLLDHHTSILKAKTKREGEQAHDGKDRSLKPDDLFIYQLALLHRHEVGAELRIGLKPFLRAA